MPKIIDVNRYQKTYPLIRYKPVYKSIPSEEDTLLVPVESIAGELFNIFNDNQLDEVYIDNFLITSGKKIFAINTNPFDLNILRGDIIMNNSFNEGNLENLIYTDETIFNGWLNQGASNINENTKYFQFEYDNINQKTDIVFVGIIAE